MDAKWNVDSTDVIKLLEKAKRILKDGGEANIQAALDALEQAMGLLKRMEGQKS